VGAFESSAYEAEIQRQVKAKGLEDVIGWVGYTRNVSDELTRMDIFVLPSLYGEGLPMVVLEAMAAGVPIIATDIDGISQIIRHGVDGVLARSGDSHSLALALQAMIKGEYASEALRRNAHARQSSEFSDERMAGSVAEVYRKVLGC
jgi:glycosyltransferase involved in cell wall biosynthesis